MPGTLQRNLASSPLPDAKADVEWTTGKASAQDGPLKSASKNLVDEEGLLPEFRPERLDRDLSKYLWNGKGRLSLKGLWEHVNRCIYLPRPKDRSVLVRTVSSAVNSAVPGPFAYAEIWDETNRAYRGLAIECGGSNPSRHRRRKPHREAGCRRNEPSRADARVAAGQPANSDRP